MPKWCTKIRDFLKESIGRKIIQIILLLIIVRIIWLGLLSSIHLGPTAALMLFVVVVFIFAQTVQDFQLKANNRQLAQNIRALKAKNRGLLQQLKSSPDETSAAISNIQPRLIGLELLFERWQTFNPQPDDSVILHEQIAIARSMAQQHYLSARKIQFIKYFAGFKIKGGAFLIQPEQQLPLVLKFDSTRNIKAETERYRDCVAGHLGLVPGEPIFSVERSGKIEGEEWGAITYNLIGANQAESSRLKTFAEYFSTHDAPVSISNALQQIFAALKPWWQNPPPSNHCLHYRRDRLYGEYDRLIRNQNQIHQGIIETGQFLQIEALRTISANQEFIDLNNTLQLRNPLHWLKTVFQAYLLGDWADQPGLRRDSIVHGDFHAGNILISQDSSEHLKAWVIDFPHTHVGPAIQDIARLEADLKFGLWSGNSLATLGIEKIHQFEVALLSNAGRSEPSLVDLVPNQMPTMVSKSPTMEKTWRTILILRKEARNYMNGFDARPYYLALLHATLPALYYRNRNPWQKLYTFISATLICERLDHPK
jgi:hypothetical protein